MVRSAGALSLALLMVLGAGCAAASELVVVEAHGLHLATGQTIDGAKPLALDDGQEITLLAANGQLVRLEGPSDAAPDDGVKGGGSDVRAAIAALATDRNARLSEVGVVRGENDVKLPDPWVVDVSHPGTSCVESGKPVVLWRLPPFDAVRVIFSPRDLSWTISGIWPGGADRVALPASMPLRDHFDYVVDLGGKLSPVTVRLIPNVVDNDAMRAGFMNAVGCGNQVGALLAMYQK